jgi:hypothetical protein
MMMVIIIVILKTKVKVIFCTMFPDFLKSFAHLSFCEISMNYVRVGEAEYGVLAE